MELYKRASYSEVCELMHKKGWSQDAWEREKSRVNAVNSDFERRSQAQSQQRWLKRRADLVQGRINRLNYIARKKAYLLKRRAAILKQRRAREAIIQRRDPVLRMMFGLYDAPKVSYTPRQVSVLSKYKPNYRYSDPEQVQMAVKMGYKRISDPTASNIQGFYRDNENKIRYVKNNKYELIDMPLLLHLNEVHKNYNKINKDDDIFTEGTQRPLNGVTPARDMSRGSSAVINSGIPASNNQPTTHNQPAAYTAPADYNPPKAIPEDKQSWFQKYVLAPIGKGFESIQNGPIGYLYDNTIGTTEWGRKFGRNLDNAMYRVADPNWRQGQDYYNKYQQNKNNILDREIKKYLDKTP